jgi:NAD(P)-dependent dehydrogenase (short-subunit alcohol dehydrogenase family)
MERVTIMPSKKRVAIVTGAAQGIGRACAERLARDGLAVMLSDVNAAAGAKTAEAVKTSGGDVTFVACDVSKPADVENLIAATLKTYGRIDVLINNAGIIDSADFIDLKLEDFDRVLGVNLRGAFLVAQAAAREMVKQVKAGDKPGSIINMSSVNTHFGLPDHVAYTVSKGGINQLTRAAAISLAKYRIRVNAIGPGTINTEIVKAVADNPAAMKKILSRTPLSRMGEPSEIASVAAFLASEDASYITGQTIFPDGGRMFLNYTVDVPG